MQSGSPRLPGALPALLFTLIVGFFLAAAANCAARPFSPPPPSFSTGATVRVESVLPGPVYPVMLGIDVLQASGFKAIAGKRIGLLTHSAGVNRLGESTIDVLRHAPNAKLVCLFSPEHGLYGNVKASTNVANSIDPHTGLPVYSLYGANRRPTATQLRGLDAVVIDLQDIGVRSYTFNVVMRYTMEACFANHVEVIVLDRPNPLGGYKVDGPLLDPEWMSGVGAYRIPYVHGLTIGELAYMAASTPGMLDLPPAVQHQGHLVIVPMRGWNRSMRWPETGLKFVPTSPLIRDFNAVIGYAMVGLGCEFSGFTHGIGTSYPFRGLSYKGVTPYSLRRDLIALHVPGLSYRIVTAPDAAGRPHQGVYIEVTNWAAWNPTEFSFALMRLACRYAPNPFAKLNAKDARSFNIHVGSTAWWNALRRDGARVNLDAFLTLWRAQDRAYQDQTRKFWLYDRFFPAH